MITGGLGPPLGGGTRWFLAVERVVRVVEAVVWLWVCGDILPDRLGEKVSYVHIS